MLVQCNHKVVIGKGYMMKSSNSFKRLSIMDEITMRRHTQLKNGAPRIKIAVQKDRRVFLYFFNGKNTVTFKTRRLYEERYKSSVQRADWEEVDKEGDEEKFLLQDALKGQPPSP